MDAPSKPQFNIIVAGDVVVDHHIYEGERRAPTVEDKRGVRDWRELGGADLVRRLLAELFVKAKELADRERVAKEKEVETLPVEKRVAKLESIKKEHAKELNELAWQTCLGVTTPALDENPCSHHAFAVWQPYPAAGGKGELVWLANALMCEYARNIDPSPKVAQHIEIARKNQNGVGSPFARNVTPP